MEFKITKEFIIEAHGAACSDWKKRIESEFTEAFKKELEIGRWYKGNVGFKSLIFITEIECIGNYNKIYYYGFFDDTYHKKDYIANRDHEASLIPATKEEITAALIAEAKKKGYKEGVTCLFGEAKDKRQLGTDCFFLENNTLYVKKKDSDNADIIFKDGIWAEILPTEKTIITREKALKILAKKLKVSPENIEIE